MQFSVAAVLAVASVGVHAHVHGLDKDMSKSMGMGMDKNVTYTTEVVTEYTTYCPEPTVLTYGESTYTVTEATTLTIKDCPCTVSKPVMTTSSVVCYDCPAPTEAPMEPPYAPTETPMEPPYVPTEAPIEEPPYAPTYANTTASPTFEAPSATDEPSTVPTAGAAHVAISGAGLVGVLGFAAFFL